MLELLETFCAVAEAGSLNKAAEALTLGQPAITRQIRALERLLGAVLLVRTAQGVRLTPAGVAVLPHAREAIAAAGACRHAALEASTRGATRLRLASGLMALQYILPPVLERFRALHPDIEVDLRPADQHVALQLLLDYEVDAAVIPTPVHAPQVRAIRVVEDPLLLVTPPPVTEVAGPVLLDKLRDATLLVLSPGSALNDLVSAELRVRDINCRVVAYPNAESIKTALALRLGVSILPRSAVQEQLLSGRLAGRPIADWPGSVRTIQLLLRAEGRPPAPVRSFADLLQEQFGRARSDPVAASRQPPDATS